MPNNQNKEEENQEINMDQFIDDLILPHIDPPTEEFKERVHKFRNEVVDYVFGSPSEFHIMGDTYLTFFKLSEEAQERWLTGTVPQKSAMLIDIDEYEEASEIIRRSLYISDILLHTFNVFRNPIYKVAVNSLLYVLTGETGFLSQKGFSYYVPPPMNSKPRIPNPEASHHDEMYR